MLPASHLMYVLAAFISDLEVTLDGLAVEGTEQVRPRAFGPLRSDAAHIALGEAGGR